MHSYTVVSWHCFVVIMHITMSISSRLFLVVHRLCKIRCVPSIHRGDAAAGWLAVVVAVTLPATQGPGGDREDGARPPLCIARDGALRCWQRPENAINPGHSYAPPGVTMLPRLPRLPRTRRKGRKRLHCLDTARGANLIQINYLKDRPLEPFFLQRAWLYHHAPDASWCSTETLPHDHLLLNNSL